MESMEIKSYLKGELLRPTFWKVVFLAIMLAGLYSAIIRFTGGLGASTNLSDDFPWGLWIGFDVLTGVGLAAGGFTITAAVYIFNLKKYKPIIRPTVLTAFLGYLLVIVALLFDLGRPYRIWHPLIMWNPSSVMFEVAWCVMLYTAVLALEFSPVLFEGLKFERPIKLVRAFSIPLVIAGVILSVLHQSSLGSLYLIVPEKLNALWYTPLLPLFFFVSAIAVGLSMVIVESYLSNRAFGKHLEMDLLSGIGRVILVVLAIYLVMRAQDLAKSGAIMALFAGSYESMLFWAEVGIGGLIPIALLSAPAIRRSQIGLSLSAFMVVIGFILNRLNVSITGMEASSVASYFPSWMELSVTAAIVAMGFATFSFAVRFFPVFESEKELKAELLRPRALAA